MDKNGEKNQAMVGVGTLECLRITPRIGEFALVKKKRKSLTYGETCLYVGDIFYVATYGSIIKQFYKQNED
ncbi:MAG: hypothetical protein A2007_03005 [Verrucomicrobia bacterium GWC2_42_7]|nr:MAG: hypothetical protein A2007_03005 [Verrucomicrobia bacterium GWC2_42_7]